jgi:hypothetical protein
MDAESPEREFLSLSEVRQVAAHAREGGDTPLANIRHAARSALHLCESIAGSPVYRSLRTRPPSQEEFESDLACAIASYRFLLARIDKSRLPVESEKVRALEDSLDANLRNLLKALPRYAPTTSKRLAKTRPSKPAEAGRFVEFVDENLERAGRRVVEAGSAEELLDLTEWLLKKREELLARIGENPALKRPLPGEGLMRALIRCLEALERILEGFRSIPTSPELESFLSAAENTRYLFESFLRKHGVYRMDIEGTRFDTDLAEAVEKVFTEEAEHHHVTNVVSHGYYYMGKKT